MYKEHHRDRPSKPPPSSSTQYRHAHNGQQQGKAYQSNGAGKPHTDEQVDHNANHTAKDGSPPKGQPAKASPTTSANGKPSSISTSVKVTVTTKHPPNKQGSKETKNSTQKKRTKEDNKKQSQPEPKQQTKQEPSRARSPDRTADRVKLSPSNVRASKPRNEPSIFHYTSTNPSNRRSGKTSKKAYDKGASTSKSAQNLSLYQDKPSTSSIIRRSSAELYEGQAVERLNGPGELDEERHKEKWREAPENSAVTHTRQPIEVEVIEAGKDDGAGDSKRSPSKERARDSALLNGGHDTERVGGVPSLWVRKPQLDLGTGSCLESNSLMQVNLKAAMYTRMFAGDLGPGQIIDPETPRDYDTTGEIRLGLKKESKADGDQLYVEVIQCRKISYKFKTENPPDLYVKGYLVVGDRKVSKKKTHIAKFTKEPKFNEVFMYNTSVTGLALQVSLWADGGRFGRNTLLGEAMIWLDNVNFIPNADSEAWYKLLLAANKSPSSP